MALLKAEELPRRTGAILFDSDGDSALTPFPYPRQDREGRVVYRVFCREVADGVLEMIVLGVVRMGRRASAVACEWLAPSRLIITLTFVFWIIVTARLQWIEPELEAPPARPSGDRLA